MTAALARRIAEIRALNNVAELRIVAVDDLGTCALVLLVPRAASVASDATDAGWDLPTEPQLMIIDPTLWCDHALH